MVYFIGTNMIVLWFREENISLQMGSIYKKGNQTLYEYCGYCVVHYHSFLILTLHIQYTT